MKRALIENVKVSPYESGDPIAISEYLSAVFAATAAAAGELVLTVTHSDEESGTYTAVKDTRLLADESTTTIDGVIKQTMAKDETANFDLDLVGCKPFIKITASGAAAAGANYAIALGDSQNTPV